MVQRIIVKLQSILSLLHVIRKDKNIPTFSAIVDYFQLMLRSKMSLEEYVNFNIYHCSKEFRDSFLPYRKAEDYWKLLNPTYHANLARDKFIGHAVMDALQIPSSQLYFAYDPTTAGGDSKLILHDTDQVKKRILELGLHSFIVKPAADSAHGQGVEFCKVDEFEEFGGSLRSLAKLLGKKMLLFESVVRQTTQMSNLNSSSVNTVRLMTALYPNQEVKIIAAFIRVGRAGACVDNAGAGGNVDCGVRIDTGELFNAIQFESWKRIIPIDNHPDSGAKMNGLVIENWEAIKQQVMEYQGQIPYLKTIGWDVALTDEGPKIIEINNWWDTTGQLFIGKGWHSEVKDCHDAWVKYNQGRRS